jgi:hypothetical protein
MLGNDLFLLHVLLLLLLLLASLLAAGTQCSEQVDSYSLQQCAEHGCLARCC